MIGIVDVEVQAANPQMPLCPFVAFVGSPSSVRVRNVPGNIGSWNITKVYVSANYPDNSIQSRECTRVGEIYVGTLPACNAVGKGANGFVVSADGVDESGNAVTGYVLGKGDLEILDADGAITPGVTTHYVHGLDEQPSDPHEYDIYKDGDTWKIYFGGAWGPLAPAPAPVTLDNTVTPTSANGVKSSGIWSAIWGALSALPTGFSSLYDWCVSQLAGKEPLFQASAASGATIKTVSAIVKDGSLLKPIDIPTSNMAVNGKALSSDVTLTGADIAVSGTDATKINAAISTATLMAAAAENKANLAIATIPYTLVTKTISNNAVTLNDRAINAVAVSSSLASLTINFPTATSGKVRDFGLRLTVASGVTTAPQIVLPQGVTCENADGEAPEIGADGTATILYFTETASGVFLVKGEVVTTIS